MGVYLFPLERPPAVADRGSSPRGWPSPSRPSGQTVDEEFGGDLAAHHESDWKRGVHRDAGSWFDLEDVRDHYAGRAVRGPTSSALWRNDPERALDLGRAAMAEVVAAAVAEWRRPGSPCAGS